MKPPEKTPRCSCGQVSKWTFDPYDETWYVSKCWRCLEIQWMLDPDNQIKRSLVSWDTDQIDRFLEIMLDDTILTRTVQVKEFKK